MANATMGIGLQDRYELEEGVALMNGVQALVRLPLDQSRADRRAGLRTAGLISGYEGSPLGGYDLELGRQRKLLADHGVTHQPGLNEELAATAVLGSQQAYRQPGALYQGVFGLWYGKAPGLDRAADAIRHANLMGVHRYGGALVCVGDDAQAKSSTIPSASEMALMELALPVLVPADPQEVLELGLHGIALSRASGLWVGLKIATNVADGSATVGLSPDAVRPVMPDVVCDGRPFQHEVHAFMLGDRLLDLERTLWGPRLEIARRYARANELNRVVRRSADDRLGLVAAGKSWRDLREALARLGLDDGALERHGIRLLKLGMPFPLETGIVREFAAGLREIIVVEEKRAFIELLFKEALYDTSDRPIIVGKRDADGVELLKPTADLDADQIALAVGRRLLAHGIEDVRDRLRPLERPGSRIEIVDPAVVRTPYFCSGCPHNSSTKVPDGSLVGGGIGCHGLALLMHEPQVGEVLGLTQMGGEGAQWIGMSPFVSTEHLIQNVGDGTFHHSASLAVRAAVAAGVNITFKILANSAVAMTGGQSIVGSRSVPELTRLLASEGVARVIVTTEDTSRYRDVALADDAEVWDRSRLIEAQEVLASIPGVTALIHDQECATELRRKRKRGKASDPTTRIFINERVCEGCGDCGVKSNCLSVHPIDTEFGRKTQIHQASCNKDYSCLEGDCPSFLTITPGSDRTRATVPQLTAEELPEPDLRVDPHDFGMRLAGVGGTGIVTVAQIIAMAARLDGRHVAGLDQVGMAQKGGAVVSDLRIGTSALTGTNKLASGMCDLFLACDLVAGTQVSALSPLGKERTISVICTSVAPTSSQVVDVRAPSTPVDALAERVERRSRDAHTIRLDAQDVALTLFGTDQAANMLLVGAAYQLGALPVSMDSLERAIELNGVAVEMNTQAIRRGRQAVCDPSGLQQTLAGVAPPVPRTGLSRAALKLTATVHAPANSELERLLHVRVPDLIDYQDRRYAARYVALVRRTREVEEAVTGEADGRLSRAVARQAYKLMAYKDEYEVARLHLDPSFKAAIAAQFGDTATYAWRLHPPILRALGMRRKITLGSWFTPAFALLRAMRHVRGTQLDLFGRAHVRRVERELVIEYETVVDDLLARLTPDSHQLALAIADLPDVIRGYEQIKLRNVELYRARLKAERERFHDATAAPITQARRAAG